MLALLEISALAILHVAFNIHVLRYKLRFYEQMFEQEGLLLLGSMYVLWKKKEAHLQFKILTDEVVRLILQL